MSSSANLLPYRFDYLGLAVSHQQTAVAHHVVDNLIVINVVLVGALGVVYVSGKRRCEARLVCDAARE